MQRVYFVVRDERDKQRDLYDRGCCVTRFLEDRGASSSVEKINARKIDDGRIVQESCTMRSFARSMSRARARGPSASRCEGYRVLPRNRISNYGEDEGSDLCRMYCKGVT